LKKRPDLERGYHGTGLKVSLWLLSYRSKFSLRYGGRGGGTRGGDFKGYGIKTAHAYGRRIYLGGAGPGGRFISHNYGKKEKRIAEEGSQIERATERREKRRELKPVSRT